MATDPNALKYTYGHYAHFPTDGKRHEIVDGKHFVNPAPTTRHQYALHQLHHQLYERIEKPNHGIIFAAPINVLLSEFTVVQPDLAVILNDRKDIITEANINGAPNMVVEVISPTSVKYDRETKKQAYQVAGVSEYWIIDPTERAVEQFLLANGKYEAQAASGDIRSLRIVPDVNVDLTKLWFPS